MTGSATPGTPPASGSRSSPLPITFSKTPTLNSPSPPPRAVSPPSTEKRSRRCPDLCDAPVRGRRRRPRGTGQHRGAVQRRRRRLRRGLLPRRPRTAVGPGRGCRLHHPDRARRRPGKAGGGGLPCPGGAAPRQGCRRRSPGTRQARHRLQQYRRGGGRPDRCGPVLGRGHAAGQRRRLPARRGLELHVERDGLLITGQNPGSSDATAEALLAALRDWSTTTSGARRLLGTTDLRAHLGATTPCPTGHPDGSRPDPRSASVRQRCKPRNRPCVATAVRFVCYRRLCNCRDQRSGLTMKARLFLLGGAVTCSAAIGLCPLAVAAPLKTGGGPAVQPGVVVDPALAPVAAAAAPIADAAPVADAAAAAPLAAVPVVPAALPPLAAPAVFPAAGGALAGPPPAVLPAGVGAAPGPLGAAAVGDPALAAPAAPLMPGK